MARNPGYPKSEVVAAAGTATISFSPTGIYPWTVDQVSTEYDSAPSGCVCRLRRNGSQITPMVASGSVADGSPPIVLNPGDRITVEWSNATPGHVVKAWITFDDGQPA
jgi:hypothetical protein